MFKLTVNGDRLGIGANVRQHVAAVTELGRESVMIQRHSKLNDVNFIAKIFTALISLTEAAASSALAAMLSTRLAINNLVPRSKS